jgi:hypothetical protein
MIHNLLSCFAVFLFVGPIVPTVFWLIHHRMTIRKMGAAWFANYLLLSILLGYLLGDWVFTIWGIGITVLSSALILFWGKRGIERWRKYNVDW